jgi:glutaredoxin
MNVLLIGKKNCGVCDSAKKKLDLMKIPYDFVDIEVAREPHEGWRTDSSVDALAFYNLGNCVIPTIVIDKVPYRYSAAMAKLKGR